MIEKIDISIILVTYNSDWEKIKMTLLSILKQKDVSMQIIVADDGSKMTFDSEINDLMKENGFDNCLILDSPLNRGTVLNIANAVKYAKGSYTKTIAPGDCLFDADTFFSWLSFMKEDSVEVSFGDAVYFSRNEKIKLYATKGSPANRDIYKSKRCSSRCSSKQFVDYVVANDTILGAAQLMKTDVLAKYLDIIQNKVVYAEDYMIRIMIYDGIDVRYYPHIVIWYEYGTGISTSKDDKWEKLLHNDFEMSNSLISKRDSCTYMQKKYKAYLKMREIGHLRKISKILIFPSVVLYRIYARFVPKKILLGSQEYAKIEHMFYWYEQ